MAIRRIRLLIVDDSALVRKVLADSLAHDNEIEVVGTAIDPYVARDKIASLKPDVLTLDIEMPRMDGLTFLKLLMKHQPIPVIIISSLTTEGSQKALEALQAGAVDVLAKPSGSYSAYQDGFKLAEKIKAAAQAKIRPSAITFAPIPAASKPPATVPKTLLNHPLKPLVTKPSSGSRPPEILKPAAVNSRQYPSRQIILMGASTGGTEALKAVLMGLSDDLPGICIVQHIPAYFSLAFANRLNEICAMEVREAKRGDIVRPGQALIAPGGFHMVLRWQVNHYLVELNEGPPVHHQRPAVDVLFNSAAMIGAGPHSLSVILTGMGADGAAGMYKLRQAGSSTIAQNEETCVVFGMPREAIRMGAAQQVVGLPFIGSKIEQYANGCAINSRVQTPR